MFLLDFDHKKCTGCAKCEVICPKVVITMKAGVPTVKDAGRCVGCTSCVEVCPEKCLLIREI